MNAVHSERALMEEYIQKMNYYGYYSILHTYHSKQEDNWLLTARYVNDKLPIKHMIAIRPYAISPEYFVMMHNSFEKICKDKLIINVIAGRVEGDENIVENSLYIGDLIDTMEKRLDYTDRWLEKVFAIKKINPLVVSGSSDTSLKMAKQYGDYLAFTLDQYNNNRRRHHIGIKNLCVIEFLIRDTYEEAENLMKNVSKNIKSRSLYGTKESILKDIQELEDSGITDIMVRVHAHDNQKYRVHEFVKEYGTR